LPEKENDPLDHFHGTGSGRELAGVTRIDAPWVTAPASRAVMRALGRGWFVGGCVRNALLGRPVTDIDIATPLVPHEVMRRLETAGIRAVPTGLAHGTVTAVVGGSPIEVTTFRADVATDGRRAEVAFTADMATDAGRRDFTMNALYADADGRLIDPLGGLPDLRAGRVRFIGRPEDRIREDYLRILRFFRFHAWYGAPDGVVAGGIDPDGLAACAALAEGIDRLARERVGWEIRKLLAAPDPAPATAAMASAGVLARCLPGADATALAPLVHVEALAGAAPDWPTRLAALGAVAGAGEAARRLRLSRAEEAALARIAAALAEDAPPAALAYRHGAEAAHAALLIRAAATGMPPPPGLEAEIARGAGAVLPLAAADLIAAGIPPGPALGRALARAEAAWLASDFALDKDALLAQSLEDRSA
jgi:poly(A) polymerase